MRNKRKNAGFTLIEIIVTLTVLGIVAAFSAPSFTGFIEDANAKDCKAKITDLTKAYTNQLVENRVTTPGSTVDTDVMEKVLADKGASKSGELTYTGLCPDGGTYTIKTVAAASDSKLTTMILSCSKHGDQEVVTGNYAQIVSIAIHTPTTTTYNVDDAFSTEGGQVIVKYSDGSTKYVDLTVDMCALPNDCMTTPGTKTITVAYGGQTAKFDISVEQTITVSSISITSTNPVKYLLGSVFDKSAISISVTYSNGAPKTINGNDSGLTYSEEPSTTNIGKKEYTLTYGGQTAKLTVDVYKLSSIEAFDYQEVYELNAVFDKNQDKAYIVPTFTDEATTWEGDKVYFTNSAVSAATADGTVMSEMGEKTVNVTYTLDGHNTASTTYSIYVGVICQLFDSNGTKKQDYTDKTNSTALNQAITDSVSGDTIKMVVTSYSFSVTQNISKNISLTITSLHPESPSTLVYGYTGTESNNANMFNITNGNVTFDSIILKNGEGGTGRAIYYSIASRTLTITNSQITGFTGSAIEKKTVKNNISAKGGAGIYFDKGNLSITNSEIDHCGDENLYYGGAIYAPVNNSNPTITIDGKTKIHNCSAQWGGVLAANISNVTIKGDTEIYENYCWGEAGNGNKGEISDDTHRMGLIAVGGGNTSHLNIKGNTHIYNNNDYNNNGDKLYNTLAILHPYAGATMTLSENVLIEGNHINGSISGVGNNYGLISGSDTTTYTMNIKDNVKIRNNSVADGAGVFGVASIKDKNENANTQTVIITGGTFTNNAGSQGAIYVANNSVPKKPNYSDLNISGNVVITGNTRVETDSATGTKTTTRCNLRTGSGAFFTVAGSGLGDAASIGVSPDDGVVEGRQFAKTALLATKLTGLDRFFWDGQTDTQYTGTASNGIYVIWKKVSDN